MAQAAQPKACVLVLGWFQFSEDDVDNASVDDYVISRPKQNEIQYTRPVHCIKTRTFFLSQCTAAEIDACNSGVAGHDMRSVYMHRPYAPLVQYDIFSDKLTFGAVFDEFGFVKAQTYYVMDVPAASMASPNFDDALNLRQVYNDDAFGHDHDTLDNIQNVTASWKTEHRSQAVPVDWAQHVVGGVAAMIELTSSQQCGTMSVVGHMDQRRIAIAHLGEQTVLCADGFGDDPDKYKQTMVYRTATDVHTLLSCAEKLNIGDKLYCTNVEVVTTITNQYFKHNYTSRISMFNTGVLARYINCSLHYHDKNENSVFEHVPREPETKENIGERPSSFNHKTNGDVMFLQQIAGSFAFTRTGLQTLKVLQEVAMSNNRRSPFYSPALTGYYERTCMYIGYLLTPHANQAILYNPLTASDVMRVYAQHLMAHDHPARRRTRLELMQKSPDITALIRVIFDTRFIYGKKNDPHMSYRPTNEFAIKYNKYDRGMHLNDFVVGILQLRYAFYEMQFADAFPNVYALASSSCTQFTNAVVGSVDLAVQHEYMATVDALDDLHTFNKKAQQLEQCSAVAQLHLPFVERLTSLERIRQAHHAAVANARAQTAAYAQAQAQAHAHAQAQAQAHSANYIGHAQPQPTEASTDFAGALSSFQQLFPQNTTRGAGCHSKTMSIPKMQKSGTFRNHHEQHSTMAGDANGNERMKAAQAKVLAKAKRRIELAQASRRKAAADAAAQRKQAELEAMFSDDDDDEYVGGTRHVTERTASDLYHALNDSTSEDSDDDDDDEGWVDWVGKTLLRPTSTNQKDTVPINLDSSSEDSDSDDDGVYDAAAADRADAMIQAFGESDSDSDTDAGSSDDEQMYKFIKDDTNRYTYSDDSDYEQEDTHTDAQGGLSLRELWKSVSGN